MKPASLAPRAPGLMLCAALLSVASIGQNTTLCTPIGPSSSASGHMFDVVDFSGPAVVIHSFDGVAAAGVPAGTMFHWSIWTKTGTWVGNTTNAAAWTLVGGPVTVAMNATGIATPIPINVNVTVLAGATQAFFLYSSTGSISSTQGTNLGGTLATNASVKILEGCARGFNANPFASTVINGTPPLTLSQKWNGCIHYGPPPAVFQVNQSGASFNVDSAVGTVYNAGNVARVADNVCSFGAVTANFASTNTGYPWDFGVTSALAVPGSGPGFTTSGGQFVNLDFTDPAFFFLNGGSFNVPFPGNFGFAFAPGGPFAVAAQLVVVDPLQADSVSLANAINYAVTYVASVPNPAPPTGDSSAVTCTYLSACGACAFDFFGTSYTQFSVTTNGRVMPGNNASNFAVPSVASAMTAPGTIGAWCNLNTNVNGNITFSSPAPGVARVAFNGVGFNGGNLGSNGVTMGIEMDTATSRITFNNLLLAPGSTQQFFGIAKGVGATNAGPSGPFNGAAPGFHAGPALATDMVYFQGFEGAAVNSGLSAIVFSPSLTGGSYDYTSY